MPPTGIFVDSNLLVLLVVGRFDQGLIARHPRLSAYEQGDYDKLLELIRPYGTVLVTPNTLTETSNLLGRYDEPGRSQLFAVLRDLIDEINEITVVSSRASHRPEFYRLGLADSALLEAIEQEMPLVTVDLQLYLAASAKIGDSAMNFEYRLNQ